MANFTTKGSFGPNTIQPGWTIEDDGFGLLTSRVTFVNDSDSAGGGPAKLAPHPEDSRLLCHKVAYTVNSARRSVAIADYVGLAQGTYTPIDFRADYSGSSESIMAHPKFSTGTAYNGATKKLLDYGWDIDAGQFDPTNADAIAAGLVGTKKFITGEMSVSGTFYTSSKEWLQKWVNGVGKTIQQLPGDSSVVIPAFSPSSPNHDLPGLLTNVSYEMYAHLYKVSFSVRVATGGWHKYIYKRAD